MVLQMIQGFDENGLLDDGWSSTSFSESEPRFGTQSVYNSSAYLYSNSYTFTLPVAAGTVVLGGGVKLQDPGDIPSSGYPIMQIRTAISEGIMLMVDSDYSLQVASTFSTSSFATVTLPVSLPPEVWNYVELKVKAHLTTGVVEVRINGSLVYSFTGKTAGTTGDITNVRVGGANTTTYWDDCYALDTTGSDNNDFLGDVRVEHLVPNADGDSSQWVGSDANSVNNWQEHLDPSFDYVESDVVNDKDLYQLGNLPAGDIEVFGVQVVARCLKTDSGARGASLLAKLGGTEVASAVTLATSGRGRASAVMETKPGGGAWTPTDVNGLQAGVKVTS
jgi:hypothetical protein